MKRRKFLEKLLIFAFGIFCIGVFAEAIVVVYRFLMPFKKSKPLKTFTCFSKDILQGQAKEIQLRGNKLILINNEGSIIAFSATCPHLGCSVKWESKKDIFLCPCHMATFDKNGKVLEGPPPRPMDQYKVVIEGNSVFVFVPQNYWAQQEA